MPSISGTANFRLVLQMRNEVALRELYLALVTQMRAKANTDAFLQQLYAEIDQRLGVGAIRYTILDLPSFDLDIAMAETLEEGAEREQTRATVRQALPWLVFGLGFDDASEVQAFLGAVAKSPLAVAGTDLSLGGFDNWCPQEGWPPLFHTRRRAADLIHADALADKGLFGAGANVVLVDTGYSKARLAPLFPGATLGHGWPVLALPGGSTSLPRLPGLAEPRSHGTVVARNVLELAPQARIFDLPTVPERITDVLLYLNVVIAFYLWVITDIDVGIVQSRCPGPWVFCNAWGIYDRRLESIPGQYTNNPTHLFNELIEAVSGSLNHDVVFAAGNCGTFCPNERCGPNDRGIGKSILGANSHPAVLTVGAVRADGLWLGYSSQGPGQPGFLPKSKPGSLLVEKPDLCAPSHFVEIDDSAWLSSGTSAACGVAAGAVVALRSGFATGAQPTTEELREALRQTASPAGGAWNRRLGHGILNLRAAVALLLP